MPYRPIPSWTLPNGMIARVTMPLKMTSAGAIANRSGTAPEGRNISLPASFMMSASGWSSPIGPTRFGP